MSTGSVRPARTRRQVGCTPPASPLEAGVYPGGGGSVSPRVEEGEAEAADHLRRDPESGAGRGEALEVYWVPLSV